MVGDSASLFVRPSLGLLGLGGPLRLGSHGSEKRPCLDGTWRFDYLRLTARGPPDVGHRDGHWRSVDTVWPPGYNGPREFRAREDDRLAGAQASGEAGLRKEAVE